LFCCCRTVVSPQLMVSDLLDEDSNFLVHQIGPLVLYRVSAAFGDNSAAVGGEAFETFLLLLPEYALFERQFRSTFRYAGISPLFESSRTYPPGLRA